MAEKLIWSELRRALAARADVSEKNAGTFMNSFIEQLIAGLKTDKQVKINGLGTFKLQAIAPRKSVDVSTGEEIIIEGYNKIVFAPEAGVKELVESQKNIDFPIDPIQKLGEQADEIVGLLAELEEVPSEEVPSEEVPSNEEQNTMEEPEVTKPEVKEPEVKEPEVKEPEVKEPEVKEPDVIIIKEEPKVTVIEKEPEVIVVEKPKKKRHFLRDVLICLVILLLLLVGCYFFLRQEISGWMDKMLEPKAQTEQVEPAAEPTSADSLSSESSSVNDSELAMIPEGEIPQEQILEEWLAITGDDDFEPKAGPYLDLIKTEPMHKDSRLAWMSKRFYGDKRFWPYLYDANRDRIENPSMIEVGTPIRVPRLTAEQLDTTNEASMAVLKQLLEEAEKAIAER